VAVPWWTPVVGLPRPLVAALLPLRRMPRPLVAACLRPDCPSFWIGLGPASASSARIGPPLAIGCSLELDPARSQLALVSARSPLAIGRPESIPHRSPLRLELAAVVSAWIGRHCLGIGCYGRHYRPELVAVSCWCLSVDPGVRSEI
jgi:hypothetical protein